MVRDDATTDVRVADPRQEPELVPAYVALRNRWLEQLLASPVTVPETEAWLRRQDVEVRLLVHGPSLLGAVVLYLGRGGEVAFFVDRPGRGVGGRLLAVVGDVARARGLSEVWAFVREDNPAARRCFVKAGYRPCPAERTWRGQPMRGVEFRSALHG